MAITPETCFPRGGVVKKKSNESVLVSKKHSEIKTQLILIYDHLRLELWSSYETETTKRKTE